MCSPQFVNSSFGQKMISRGWVPPETASKASIINPQNTGMALPIVAAMNKRASAKLGQT